MKKWISILVMTSLFCSLVACSSNKETSTEITVRTALPTAKPSDLPKENSISNKDDLYTNTWYGVGIYNRCTMATKRDGNSLTVQVTWGNSASSTYQYDFSGILKDDVLNYANLVEKEVISDEKNKISEEIINQDLSGQIFFHNNMAFWNNTGQSVILATDDEYIQDATIIGYTGAYGSLGLYQHVTMDFNQKESQVSGTIYWSDSASEQYQYSFGGTIDGDQAILNNIKTTLVTNKEDGSKEEKVLSENGSGTIYFSKNFITVMSDQEDFVIPFIK